MKNGKQRLALMDMYNGTPNQGMRCIREILDEFTDELEYDSFDVRAKNEVPDLSYDIFISTGGPGNPILGNGLWDEQWYQLIDDIWSNNLDKSKSKKYVFFICHSFQMACKHFELGVISKRKSKSFGIMPVHKTKIGKKDHLLDQLQNPYYVVDSREYQILQPDLQIFQEHHAQILSLEDIHTHFEDERAIMAVRFSPQMSGTQFHPEADPEGMKTHFQVEKNRNFVIQNFSEETYQSMLDHIDDPDRLRMTHTTIIPNFIRRALEHFREPTAINMVI